MREKLSLMTRLVVLNWGYLISFILLLESVGERLLRIKFFTAISLCICVFGYDKVV